MSEMKDEYDLRRFVGAQEPCYNRVLSELRNGRKCSDWMWFIFPQLRGLGHSTNSVYYSIRDEAEAKAYLRHPVLGPRLIECAEAALSAKASAAEDIFGHTDSMKLRSCATLFARVSPSESVFQREQL
jgi:uncharacterized protein (DUF1810 family)